MLVYFEVVYTHLRRPASMHCSSFPYVQVNLRSAERHVKGLQFHCHRLWGTRRAWALRMICNCRAQGLNTCWIKVAVMAYEEDLLVVWLECYECIKFSIAYGIHCVVCWPSYLQLLDHRAAVNVKNDLGNTPLHYACFWNHIDAAKVNLLYML